MNAGHAIIDCHDKKAREEETSALFLKHVEQMLLSVSFYAVKIVSARVRHYELIKPST